MMEQIRRLAPALLADERSLLVARVGEPYGKLLAMARDVSLGRDARLLAVNMLTKLVDLKASTGIDPVADLQAMQAHESDAEVKKMLEVMIRRASREAGSVTQVVTPGGSEEVIRRLQTERKQPHGAPR